VRFLIDECLSVDLVTVAGECSHEAQHVAHVGRAGWKDWNVVGYLRDGDFVLVTNNASDFRQLYTAQPQNRFSAKSGSSPHVNRRERQLARRGRERDGRACSPSVPRTSAKVATAPTSASAPATAKAASKPPVAATT
jgi:hypothetical protein